MDMPTLLAFAAAFAVFAASPGPDNMAIVARTLTHGASSGIAYGAGTVAGILFFLSLAALGLSVIAQEMGWAMTLLRYGGAAWLVWTGIQIWRAPPHVPELGSIRTARGSLTAVFATGLVLNLGNPKMPLFYLALLPNVVGSDLSGPDLLELASVIVMVECLVIGGHVLLASKARRLLRTERVVRRVNRTAGGLMIGSGVAAATIR